jgi:hypothetical protein
MAGCCFSLGMSFLLACKFQRYQFALFYALFELFGLLDCDVDIDQISLQFSAIY